MAGKKFAEQVLHFNKMLSCEVFNLPDGFKVINPYGGDQRALVKKITTSFYHKYYGDTHIRRIILGSSPARRGSAITGVPFESAKYLQKETGVSIDKFYINPSASDFLNDVIEKYGGRKKFYTDFYMNYVCPVGLVRINKKGNEVNCNYYENKELQEAMYSFIIRAIQSQINFGIDTSVCYCIGSGENYSFLSKINRNYNFFDTIIPLEHPRYIMQYNSKLKDVFMEKYINSLYGYTIK